MDGMGHGGFARGQTKDLRKGLKTREGRAKLTSFKQLPAPLLTPFSQILSLSSLRIPCVPSNSFRLRGPGILILPPSAGEYRLS